MKTTSLSFLAIATTFALQACAAPTTDIESPARPDTQIATPSNDEGESTPAAKLSGAFGAPSEATMQAGASAMVGGETKAGSPVPTQLFFKDTNTTYSIYSFDFGVFAGASISTGASREAAKPVLAPLTVTMKGSPLANQALTGKPVGDLVLRRVDSTSGKIVDVAKFGNAKIIAVQSSTAGDDGVYETYALSMESLEVSAGSVSTKYDAIANQATISDSLACNGAIPGFVQSSQSSDLIAKGNVRVDAVSVGVSGSPAVLDGMNASGLLSTMGVCALFAATNGAPVKSARLAVAVTAPSSTWKPVAREATSWETCAPQVKAFSISGAYDGVPLASVTLDAAGMIRTDRTFDNYGAESSKTSFGWSFAQNRPIASCADVFTAP